MTSASYRLHLLPHGVAIDDQPPLRSRLLPRLIAALLQAHAQGLAREEAPCTRTDLCERIGGMAELHRTQVWRALALLATSPLEGLIQARARSGGPFWLDAALLARCAFIGEGAPAIEAPWAALLAGPTPTPAPRPASVPLLPLSYTAALARADHLLDRGELYPARLALQQAGEHCPAGDIAAAAALALRRARIARRLGDWAALQDELRELGQALQQPGLPGVERQQLRARVAILGAWHWYGSLGQAGPALARLDDVDTTVLTADSSLRADHGNLRGIVLRELALARDDDLLARESLAALGDAVRTAALAGLPDALQVCAANLANTQGQLADARLLPADGPALADALRWLLLSDALCEHWQVGRSSLLNLIFLLRLAAQAQWPFATVQAAAAEQGVVLAGTSYASLAAARWAACRPRQSQIPADQRCAFLLLWARHALDEGDPFTTVDLIRQARLQARKLRDEQARRRYTDEAQALHARLEADGLSAPGSGRRTSQRA